MKVPHLRCGIGDDAHGPGKRPVFVSRAGFPAGIAAPEPGFGAPVEGDLATGGNGRGAMRDRLDARQACDASKASRDRFPPTYPDVVADHVTLAAHRGRQAPLPCETSGEIVGASPMTGKACRPWW
jgi:hypothetical protein